MRIFDRIDECDDGDHRERGRQIEGVTIHMFAVPGIHNAQGIAIFYRFHPEWTGGQMPYTFVIDRQGVIEQALPIGEVGPHALRWSSPTIGVVHLGDGNLYEPSSEQWVASIELCAEICASIGVLPMAPYQESYRVAGHTERPHATRARGKSCPGKCWDLDRYRRDVARQMRESAVQRLRLATR